MTAGGVRLEVEALKVFEPTDLILKGIMTKLLFRDIKACVPVGTYRPDTQRDYDKLTFTSLHNSFKN